MSDQGIADSDIAIIGMSCRLPGASNADEFWRNLCDGVESIKVISDDELRAALLKTLGYVPEEALKRCLDDPNYVRASAGIKDIDLFDAEFFGYAAPEAELIDPQQRLFLECCWEALEDASYTSETYQGLIGVYGGTEVNSYYPFHDHLVPEEWDLLAVFGNDSNYLTTRVSYKLDLKGPSFNIQCSCSTSLAAIHMACQSLKSGECDIALAGGVVAYTVQEAGYIYQEGGIHSPDGHCRPFDGQAQGVVFANGGVGVVALKLLTEALDDGDHVYAVIKGSAANNDGSLKTGYAAPGVDGQARVLQEAMAVADVDPESISYIEAHGTGTPIGDAIEIAVLKQVFESKVQQSQNCALGSVKSNMGHLGVAAGVTGLIKTSLALKHRMIPPTLHYTHVNPQIDYPTSPFYINSKLSEWKNGAYPRRAGVNSFGMGGTNVHVVLEEPPLPSATGESRDWQLLTLSAKTESALETMTANLIAHLKQHPDISLADLAYTLHVGRKTFPYRRMLVCSNVAEALQRLEARRFFTYFHEHKDRPVAFMFSGQGIQYVNMGLELYQQEPVFREQVDNCAELLKPLLGFDLREVLFPRPEQLETARQRLDQTSVTQPAIFVIEYAMAKFWMTWGIVPQTMIGHSIGEYVAACVAGVFSLEDALALVVTRGKLVQKLPAGAMITVALSEQEVQKFISPQLSLAAYNGANDSVISGPLEAIEQLERLLAEKEITTSRLSISHAFHSQMMDSIVEPFSAAVSKITLHAPKIPYVSNVTGKWITPQEATDPGYWGRHLRSTVRFAEGLQVLLKDSEITLLELGPGLTLTTLARRHPEKGANQMVLPSLPHFQDPEADMAFLMNTCGRLWCAGVPIQWSAFHANEQRHRLSLPTYPFERKRYWRYPKRQISQESTTASLMKMSDISKWFSVPSWKQSILLPGDISHKDAQQNACWLVFTDAMGLGSQLINRLAQSGEKVITVLAGEQFGKRSDDVYTLSPQRPDDYVTLLEELNTIGALPTHIVHLWTTIAVEQERSGLEYFEEAQYLGCYSLLFLAQALDNQNIVSPLQITVVTNNLQEVIGEEVLCPVRATVLGPGKVIPREYPHITCRSLDIVIPESNKAQEKLIDQVVAELRANSTDLTVAYRNTHRWVQTIESLRLEETAQEKIPILRERGVYLITGGAGGMGSVLAEYLASTVQARLVLLGRTNLPPREQWEHWLATHERQDKVARRIHQVQSLEKLGTEVLVISADVTNYAEMQAAIEQIYERFGELHGVIHAAGIIDANMIPLKTAEAAARVLAPKVKGSLVLEAVLKERPLDFFVLSSSLSSVLGGAGFLEYCAANVFLDSFAFYNTAMKGTRTIAINWDGWLEVGMIVDSSTSNKHSQSEQTQSATKERKDGILSKEGVEVFKRVLSQVFTPRIIVSTRDIQALLKQMNRSLQTAQAENAEQGATPAIHSRPRIQTSYVAPRNDWEQQIAHIWQKILGLDTVGIYDDFFELGGDSVMIIQAIKQIKNVFQVDLPMQLLFEASTIEELATAVANEQLKLIDNDLMQDLLKEVEQTSEEEAVLQLENRYSQER